MSEDTIYGKVESITLPNGVEITEGMTILSREGVTKEGKIVFKAGAVRELTKISRNVISFPAGDDSHEVDWLGVGFTADDGPTMDFSFEEVAKHVMNGTWVVVEHEEGSIVTSEE